MPDQASSDGEAIRHVVQQITASWLNKQYDDIGLFIAEHAVIAPPGSTARVRGRAAYIQSYRDYDQAATALVFQHGNTPADYQQANRYAEQAIDLGSERGRHLYALTRDRYLRSIGEPQQFGTQYRLESGTWQLVLQPYDPTTTDAERARYNVPPLARLQAGPPGGLNSPLLLLLVQVLVLVGLLRLAWLGVRWLWRRSTRRKQAAATASEAG